MFLSQRGKSVLVCLLIGTVSAFVYPTRTPSVKAAQSIILQGALQGEAALQQLKAEGSYDSLAAAMNASITQERKLTAEDGAADDQFGTAVALSGDTAVIGAPADDVGGSSNQGSAYIFVRSGTGWSPQAKLTASDGAANDFFGEKVALSGDTIVVGAQHDDSGANADQGSVYVFTRNGTSWEPQAKLTASDGAANDLFGEAIALNGDTLVAGARGDDVGVFKNQGSAYVFVRNGGSWTQQQRLNALGGAAEDEFGASVTVSGDTIVVGAPLDDNGTTSNQGAAYVFVRQGASWAQQQQLLANDAATGDLFGNAVSLNGDTVAIGAPLKDFTRTLDLGAVYLFKRAPATTPPSWTQEQRIWKPLVAGFDQFGQSVALSGDTLVVGAFGSDDHQGAAYIFARSGTAWAQQRRLMSDGNAAGESLGFAVALSGDLVLLGAPQANGTVSKQGAAYAFTISANLYAQQPQLAADDGAANDNFGSAVAFGGNALIIGAPRDDIGANADQGSAYVFVRNGAGWMQQARLVANTGAANDLFGQAVAINGDTAVVGASGDSNSRGAAYVFARTGSVWTQQPKLTARDGESGDYFGFSVALSDNTIAVGAVGDTVGTNAAQGSAYIFSRNGGPVWLESGRLIANTLGKADDNFGRALALNGNTLLIGAPNTSTDTNMRQGAVYVFSGNGSLWKLQQQLLAEDGRSRGAFGRALALDGNTAVIGAVDVTGLPDNLLGAAYVFTSNGVTWTQQQKLKPYDGDGDDRFGSAVAISGDTIMVGAPLNDFGLRRDQGAVFGFTRNGSANANGWTAQQPKLTASDGAANDRLGYAVAMSGDLVLAGAFNDDLNARTDQGSAYVFARNAAPFACPAVTLNPASLPEVLFNRGYLQDLTVSGSAEPYQFALSDGVLPPGVVLLANGMLRGTTTLLGTYRFTVTATNLNTLCTSNRAYTVTVNPSPGCEAQFTPAAQVAHSGGASASVNISIAAGCGWYATSDYAWLKITAGSKNVGSGELSFAVSPNPHPAPRRGALIVAGRAVEIQQAAPSAFASAASYLPERLATESIASAFGNELATTTAIATTQPLPDTLAGTRVAVFNTQGELRYAPLFFVSPTQINFLIPADTAQGKTQINIIRAGETIANHSVAMLTVSPGLFAANANGQGVAAGLALRIKADGSQSYEPLARYEPEKQRFVAVPIDLSIKSDRVFLVLFGTGFRYRTLLSTANATIGGLAVETLYAGPQGSYAGLDQLNLTLPLTLSGRGEVDIAVSVDGKSANLLKVAIQ